MASTEDNPDELQCLLEKAKTHAWTSEERTAQIISFVYSNISSTTRPSPGGRGAAYLCAVDPGEDVSIKQLLILGRTMRSLDSAGQLLASLDAQGRIREAVSLMKIATHLNKAVIETARMMILVAPEGVDVSSFDAVISEASNEAERLEIAAISVEAALEDKGNG